MSGYKKCFYCKRSGSDESYLVDNKWKNFHWWCWPKFKRENTIQYQTMDEAGYTHECCLGNGEHILKNREGKCEVWFVNKNHASYGIIYKNTHLEFARDFVTEDYDYLKF